MRNLIAVCLLLCVFHNARAQWTGPDASSRIYYNSGQVGIGTIPSSKLHIKTADSNPVLQIETNDASMTFVRSWLELKPKPTFTSTPYISWFVPSGTRQAILGSRTDSFGLLLENGYNFSIQGGNVGIGVTDTKGYQLAVAGKAVAEEVVVKLRTNWPDYVFEQDYALTPLPALEDYIKKNKHLPEVPSAEEVFDNGVALGQMNKVLLKKIEELTLYLIEERKISSQLQSEMVNLKSQFKNFSKNR
jgi:hypothetical protein